MVVNIATNLLNTQALFRCYAVHMYVGSANKDVSIGILCTKSDWILLSNSGKNRDQLIYSCTCL